MALSDKDIVITPNRGQASDPKIEFKGASAAVGAQTITLNVYPTNSGKLSFESSAGALFSINNDSAGVVANTSLSSPIFYDLDNTAYYVDPNSTSNLVGLTVANTITGSITGTAGGETLATVTARGASTSTSVTLSGGGNQFQGHFYYLPYDSAGNHYPHFNDGANGTGVQVNWRLYTGASNTHTHVWRTDYTYFANRVESAGDMRTPIYYDSENTGYYLNPNGSSYLNSLILSGSQYFRPQTWIQFDNSYGLYWPNNNAAHIYANTESSYGSINIRGSRNGWRGIHFYDGGYTPHLMFDGSGNGGTYYESSGRWASYYNYSNDSWGLGTSSTFSAWNMYAPKGFIADTRIDSPIYYDSANTGYYLDAANSGTALNVAGDINLGNSGSNTGVAIYHGNGSGDYGRIRFYQAGSNNQTIHVFPTTWQGGTLAGQSAGSINLTGANGVTFGNWNDVAGYISTAGALWIKDKIGIGVDASAKLHIQRAAPSGAQSVNTAATVVLDNTGNNFIEFRNSADNNSYQGLLFTDNNQGGYVVFGNAGGAGDMLRLGGYNSISFDVGTDNSSSSVALRTQRGYIDANANLFAYGSVRSPIFYDSDDTAYYADPNSTTRLLNLTVVNTISGSISGNADTVDNRHADYFYPASTPNGYSAGDINGNTTHQRLWGTDSIQNLLQFRPPTTVEYSTDGSTWTSTSISADVFDGKIFGKWGGFNLNVGNNLGAWRYVRLTWTNFGYHFWSHITLSHSTNGHSFNLVFYRSSTDGNTWTETYRQNGISSWPGYTFSKYSDVSGWWDTRDVRIVFELNHNNDHPNNPITVGHIGLSGSYSSFTRLYDWDGSRNVTFGGNITAPILYDSNNTAYYVDPNSTSNLVGLTVANTITGSITGTAGGETLATVTARGTSTSTAITLSANSNRIGNLYVGYGTYKNSITPIDDTNMNLDTPSGYIGVTTYLQAAGSLRAPIFYDSNDTGYYLDPHNTGTALNLAGYAYIGKGISSGYYLTLNHDQLWAQGTLHLQYSSSGNIDMNNGGGYTFSRTSLRAPIFYDYNDTTYYLDPASSGKALLVNGNIELTARSESWAEGIRINVPTAGTWGGIRINRSGASGPGNWAIGYTGLNSTNDLTFYSGTTDTIQVNLDHSANLSSIGSMRAPIFYDLNDTAFYANPAGDSEFKFTRFSVSGYPIIALNNTNSGTYGLIEWTEAGAHKMWMGMGGSGMSLGEYSAYAQDGFSINHDGSGAFTISNRGGSKWIRLSTGDEGTANFHTLNIRNGDVIVNQNAISYSSMDNTPVVGSATTNRLHVNGSIQLTGNNDAIVFGRGTSTFLKDEELGFGWGGGWYMTDGDWIRARNDKNIYSGTGIIRSDSSVRAPIFYDQDDTGYYIDPNSTSNSALRMRGGALFGPNTTWGAYLYVGTDGRVGTDATVAVTNGNLHLDSKNGYQMYLNWYSTENIYTQGNMGVGNSSASYRLHVHGTGYATSDFRAPIFYDSDNTAYYVDPNSTSRVNVVHANYFLGEITDSGSGDSNAPFRFESDYSGWDSLFAGTPGSSNGWGTFWAGNDNPAYYYFGASNPNEYVFVGSGGVRASIDLDNGQSYFGTSVRSPIFYDSDDTSYYLDPASTTTSLQVAGTVEQGNNYAHPNIDWGASGTSTGMIIFYLPGTTSNYGMVHMVFDIYEYNSPRTATVIVGGHNWNIAWYNTACNVVGYTDKQVRLGVKDGRFVVVFGTEGSTWSYGQIRLRKIQNGSYYNNVMDLGGNWGTTQTTTESFSWVSGDLRNLRTPRDLEVDNIIYGYGSVRSPIFYDQNDTNYYCDPNGTSRLNDVFPNQIYNYGWFRNQSSANGLYNTANDSHFYSAGPNYWHINPDNGDATYGGLIFYNQYNSSQGNATGRKGYVYWDSTGFGLLDSTGNWAVNLHSTNYKRVTIGGSNSNNPYSTVDGIRLMFGGGDDNASNSYYIGTNFENYGGNYTKLDLRWHTGIRMGAQPNYGGVRIYDSEDLGTVRFSVNKGDAHTRVESGDFYAANLIDRDDTSYYLDPRSTSRLSGLRLDGVDNNASGNDAIFWINKPNNNDWAMIVSGGLEYGIRLDMAASHSYAIRAQANGSEYSRLGTDLFYHNSSIQAPIFYDSDNTNYYVDPANSTFSAVFRGPIVAGSGGSLGGGKLSLYGVYGSIVINPSAGSNNATILASPGISFQNSTGATNYLTLDGSGNGVFLGTVTTTGTQTTTGNTNVSLTKVYSVPNITTTAATTIFAFNINTYRSVKLLIQITQGTNYQVSEAVVIHNGTNAFFTEYGVVETNGTLGTISCTVNTGTSECVVSINMLSAVNAVVTAHGTLMLAIASGGGGGSTGL